MVRINVHFSKEAIKQLDACAEALSMSRASVIRLAIQAFLAQFRSGGIVKLPEPDTRA